MSLNNLTEKLEKYKGVFLQPPQNVPTNKVVDGPLLGNGDVGTVWSGLPDKQRLWISKVDFWKAKRLYEGGSPCLLGGIDIHIPELEEATYYAEQRLLDATVTSLFKRDSVQVSIHSWVAATQNSIVIELVNEGASSISVELELWVQSGHESHAELLREDDVSLAIRKFNSPDLDWPTEGVVAMCTMDCKGNQFVLDAGERSTIVAHVLSNHDEKQYTEQAVKEVKSLNKNSVLSLHSKHTAWWEQFWSKSSIEIGDELIEKFWYGSHYIMACCSRNKTFAPGLFGNWITKDSPAWAGDYHLNYNYQAPWWGVYSSNHIELSEPYDTPLLNYMDNGRRYAREYLGMSGIYYDVGIGPKGLPTVLSKTDASLKYENGHLFLGQKSNTAYCSINMLMRYYYTYDLEYAKETAYPFLIEVANFWEDYMVFEEGRYVIYRDAIHEVATWQESHPDDEWVQEFEDMNPILTLGLLRMLFRGLLDLTSELGIDGERHEKWQHILEHISDFPIFEKNGTKIFRLTEQGREWWDDNTLAIQHIWPAGAIGLDSDPDLLQIAKDTITVINRWTDYNGFPTIFTAAARVGYDPDVIMSQLRRQCEEHSYPNLFIFFGGGGIECCSGVPSAINEMLIQSHEHVIKLFPVWNRAKDARFTDLRAVGAFLVSSELSQGEVSFVEIKSEKGRLCRVLNPWMKSHISVVEVDDSVSREVEWQLIGDVISFATEKGKTYQLRFEQL